MPVSPPDQLDLRDATAVADTLHACAELNRTSPQRRGGSVHLGGSGQLLITGDLHDNSPNFARILKAAKLDAAEDRHLILHEVIHGEQRLGDADLSIRTLARAAALKVLYPHQVHLLQSNHELAQMLKENILKHGTSSVAAFDEGLDHLYHDQATDVADAVDDYVCSLPLCVRCSNGLFIAHSLPSPRKIESFDPAVIDREPTDDDLAIHGSAYDMVWGRHQNKKITEELADRWGAAVFVLGHQPADMGHEPVADNALVLASDHTHGVVLPVDLAKTYTRDELIDRLVYINAIPLP